MWKEYKSKAHLSPRYTYSVLICSTLFLLALGPGRQLRLPHPLSPVPPLTPAGVVIEALAPSAALARAGLRVGDVLDAWERGPTEKPLSRGALRNVFDWLWLVSEQAPRGDLRLAGRRAGRPLQVAVPAGIWEAEVRPLLPPPLAAAYHQGRTLIAAGNRRQGIAQWRRVAARARSIDKDLSDWMLLRIGQTWAAGRRWAEAHRTARQALRQTHQPRPRMVLLQATGEIYQRGGNLASAARAWRQAQRLQERVWGPSLGLAKSAIALGSIAWQRGDLERVETHWRRALYLHETLAPESQATAEAWGYLGRLARRRGDFDLALHYLGQAFDTLESAERDADEAADDEHQLQTWRQDLYREIIEVLVRLGRSEEAFNVLERSRARNFLAMLEARPHSPEDIPPDLAQNRQRLAAHYDHIQQALAAVGPGQSTTRRTMLLVQQHLLRQRQALDEQIRAATQTHLDRDALTPLTLETARQALDPGTVMLSYSVGRERSLLFVVSREHGLQVATLPTGTDALREKVTSFRQRLRVADTRHRHRRRKPARELYDLLLAPVADLITDHQRILFIPDGPLHLLPFGALVRHTTSGDEHNTWQYVVEWKPFHLALSATVYQALKRNRPTLRAGRLAASFSIAAFADPDLPTRSPAHPSSFTGETHLRSTAEKGSPGAPLPYSRREVEQIRLLFPGAVSVFVGAEATEERVKAIGERSRYLHIATHGMIDSLVPLDSALALAVPKPGATGGDNGLLQAWEIHERLRLNADLVVLSACSSGLGTERRGEGLIGLTRAFHYAGARSVAASMWNVNDRSTAELMVRFYRHLKSGMPKDEALRSAQIELIRAPISSRGIDGQRSVLDARSPYHWAAFQIFGDWR